MDKFTKFLPITKVEEQADGTIRVYGIVTAEQPDRDKEVCDYAKTVPFYKAAAEEMLKITSVDGMEQSCMPLREMHNLVAVGKGISMDFDDATKTIRMGFEVVAAETIKKVKKGVLPAFSQGGDYVEKYADPTFAGCTRYVANPGEVSLVDRGCLPGAVIEAIKGRSFQLQKKDGSIELVKFENSAPMPRISEADAELIAAHLRKSLEQKPLAKEEKTKRVGGKDLHASDFAHVGDSQDTSTWKLPVHDAAHARNALARFNQTEGIPEDEKAEVKAKIRAAAKKHGVQVADEAEKVKKAIHYMQACIDGKPLEKGLYQVAQMAQILETIHWMQIDSVFEREAEGDASVVPEDFGQLLEDAVGIFHSMVEEETEELMQHAAAISGRGEKAMTEQELKKAADDLLEKTKGAKGHLKDLHSMHKAFTGKVSKHMDEMNETVGKCGKALGMDPKEFDAEGSGPDPEEITNGGEGHGHETGGAAPAAKRYIECGKASDGSPLFKLAPVDPSEAILAKLTAMESSINERIEKGVEEGISSMLKAMFDSTEGAPILTAPGVGNRDLLHNRGPMANGAAVTKAAEMAASGAAVEQPKPVEVTKEDVEKAMQGDPEARLKIAKLRKLATEDEAVRIQGNISGVLHK